MVLAVIVTLPIFTAAQKSDTGENGLSIYEKLKKTASETGDVKVIVKLDVKNIKKLTGNSTQYKTVNPGRTFPFAGIQADLELKNAIHEKAYSVLHQLNGKGYQLNHTFSTLPYLALDVSPEALALLPTLPEVLEIFEDRPWKLVDNSFASTQIDSPMLDTSVGLIGAADAWAMGYTGSGWYVVILDTGIRRTHQFFQGKTIVEACFSLERDCPNGSTEQYGMGAAAHYESIYDGYDHGTHVTGIAAGKYGSLAGVAKNSNIIAVQVFSRFSAYDCDGSPCVMSWESDQLKGLEYVYTLRGTYSIAAVNMSLGGGRYSSYCDYALQKPAIDNLKAVRIATVIATGNDGYCGSISSPACISSAVAVGASNKNDEEAYFNNWHSTLQEFFAPGVSISSSTGSSNSSYSSWSGTSMAAPHVTGAWALLRQASSSSSVDTIFNALRSTGTPISSPWCSGGPIPRINVDEAINQLVGGSSSITVISPNGGESWAEGSTHPITWTSTGLVGNVKIEYSTNNGSSWFMVTPSTANDSTHSWTIPYVVSTQCLVRISEASDGIPSDISDAVFSITGSEPSEIMLSQTQFNFGAIIQGPFTGPQSLRVENTGGSTLHWTATPGVSWLTCSPSSGTNAGVIVVSVNAAGYMAGSYLGVINVADPGAINSPQTVTVNLTVKNASQDEAPFGTFETPLEGSIISGSVPLTGWALDDLDVVSVKIYRQTGSGLVYIGDTIFVEGARPDVAQVYPGYPKNSQAGWGYMLLTHFLPNGGNGTFVLSAIAVDVSGKQTILGSKTVIADNANAVKPFGAIDYPVSGGVAGGTRYRNSGWVLTPLPNKIPEDGSTINVYVDGVYLGHPTYNIYRADIAQLFPVYANSNGAHAYLDFDTTSYNNGIHTIYWTATDNVGNADGIGSRYFFIQNSGAADGGKMTAAFNVQRSMFNVDPNQIPSDYSHPVRIKEGYHPNAEPVAVYPDDKGMITIEIKELERIEIRLFPVGAAGPGPLYSGFQVIGSQLKPLPIGSTLDMERGIFYWQPGPGFLGQYEFVFTKNPSPHEVKIKKTIKITIVPRSAISQDR
jgi:subtilisin family serine protease